MLKNYTTLVLRQIFKNKLFSLINILGLSFGMAICLVIYQYVGFHSSFDAYHEKADRLFRLEEVRQSKDKDISYSAMHSGPMGALLSERSPVVEDITRIARLDYLNSSVSFNDNGTLNVFKQTGIVGLEDGFFSMFSSSFVAGGSDKFDQPYKAIISESAGKKYFDDPQQAVGKLFTLKGNTGEQVYELVGVMADVPAKSHLQFELALSFPSMEKYLNPSDSWDQAAYSTYIEVASPEDVEKISATAAEIYSGQYAEKLAASGDQVSYLLQNIQDIHLNNRGSYDGTASVDKNIILILSLIAIVVLAVAWINYLNLSLVRTLDRMKEMGVRKCLGSSRGQLVYLFVMESLVMNVLSLAVTILLVNLFGGYLSQTTALPTIDVMSLEVMAFLGAIVFLGTLVTGFYPLVILKSFNLVSVLTGKRGKMANGKSRKVLVVVQFAVTFLLIAGTLTIFRQISFMRNADLGIDTENVLVIQAPPSDVNADNREDKARFRTMTTEMLKYPGVEAMTTAGEVPGQGISWNTLLKTNEQADEQKVPTSLLSMSLGFTDFFGIEVVAGRNLREGDDPWSRGDVVINERLAEQLGFANPEDAIGANLEGFFAPLQIRGVLENHHHTSLHNDYQPIAYILSGWTRYYFFKLRVDENSEYKADVLKGLIADMQGEWDEVFPNYRMEYSFVDQAFNRQYQEDVRFGKIFTGFSIVTIVIACLGLFGLTALTVNQRIKEVGIRKVLGANGLSLMGLLSKEYAVLVLLAGVVSMPLAYYLMSNWLESYSFRIDLGFWFFLVPFLFVFGLAIISVIGKIWTVVKSNPVEALRYE